MVSTQKHSAQRGIVNAIPGNHRVFSLGISQSETGLGPNPYLTPEEQIRRVFCDNYGIFFLISP